MTGDVSDEYCINRGIIPRTIQYLFEKYPNVTINISAAELYNEKLLDLLKIETSKSKEVNDLPIREDQNGNIVVPGLTQKHISNYSEFMHVFSQASSRRSTAPTNLNKESSRSHSILTIYLVGFCKIHLIDLAGSEDNRLTGNVGKQLLESSSINRSLFQLRKVVDALHNNATTSKRQIHVSYRDSKLTRLLQDSLGGTSRTILIANISEDPDSMGQTFKTLQFAAKSHKIINRVAPTLQESSFRPSYKKSRSMGNEEEYKRKLLSPILRERGVFGGKVLERLERLESVVKDELSKVISANKQQATNGLKRSRSKSLDDKENINPSKKLKTEVTKKQQPATVDAAQLLSPVSKHKEAKSLLKKGNSFLAEKDYQKAYYYFNQASILIPENGKLQEKVALIRKKAGVEGI
jgi:kinesin family protein 22